MCFISVYLSWLGAESGAGGVGGEQSAGPGEGGQGGGGLTAYQGSAQEPKGQEWTPAGQCIPFPGQEQAGALVASWVPADSTPPSSS